LLLLDAAERHGARHAGGPHQVDEFDQLIDAGNRLFICLDAVMGPCVYRKPYLNSGKHLLAASISPFDPGCVKTKKSKRDEE
jgi:hypothetical protein